MAARILQVIPVLMVRDVAAALRFYAGLGFVERLRDEPADPRYAGVRRDGVDLHFQWHDAAEWDGRSDRPSYRFPVDDPDALWREIADGRAAGAVFDAPWGTREFHLRDPDGNVLQFFRLR